MVKKTKKLGRREKSTQGTSPDLREEVRSLRGLWGLNEPDNAKSKDTRPPRARRDVLQGLEPETPKAKPKKIKKRRSAATAPSSAPPPSVGKGLPRESARRSFASRAVPCATRVRTSRRGSRRARL